MQISPLLQIPFLQILILRSVLLLKGEKTMKKRVFALLLAAVMLSMHLTTFAAGWEQFQSGEWMYYNADGSYKTDTWIGNYYVDSSGCMLRNGWTPDGYWVGNDGAWEPQWGQRHDDVAPWPGKPYRGTYTYVFYRFTICCFIIFNRKSSTITYYYNTMLFYLNSLENKIQ